jgi:hypothetical protein
MAKAEKGIFKTNKRIRLGIWGLGRGMSFFKTCNALNIDVVAGCDFNEHMRKNFKVHQPDAFVTADADEFLKQDIDAVLLATFCPAHADDAIRCLQAGTHVLSEVTAFHTMAEGVRLVEAVEKSGKVYNLAENYPFTPANMYLARKWREGLFGELMYGEYEYVHECRTLAYTYIDGVPVQPGWNVHNWRSWLNYHYYCTHSLGPVMVITGTRPVAVQALPCKPGLAGYLMKSEEGMGGAAPSMIRMSNGGLVRNLMGATTNDSHQQRLWGTLGAAEINDGRGLQLRLGGTGGSPKMEVRPNLDALGELAAKSGHGGGDFWVLYYFARQILSGEAGPFDIYGASDVTIPGILAFRSSCEGGRTFDVPDFRKRADRDAWRTDNWDQKRFDVKNGCFPANADKELVGQFSTVMKALVGYASAYRAFVDWDKVKENLVTPGSCRALCAAVAKNLDGMLDTYILARKIADAYPKGTGARVLREMLEVGYEAEVRKPGFKAAMRRKMAVLARRYPEAGGWLSEADVSPLQPAIKDVRKAERPGRTIAWKRAPYLANANLIDIRPAHGGKDGLVYIRGTMKRLAAGPGSLNMGADGPFRVWLNGQAVGMVQKKGGPATADEFQFPVKWKKGPNEVVVAQLTNAGISWGIQLRGC